MRSVTRTRIVEPVVTAAILINLPIAAWVEITHDELAEKIDLRILLFFACEIGVRVVLAIKRRGCDASLVLDTTIVVLALSGLPIMRAARLAHLSRHVAHLRHVTVARGVSFARVGYAGNASRTSRPLESAR